MNQTETYCDILEGDCFKYLNQSFLVNGYVHLTFFDPPYRQIFLMIINLLRNTGIG